MSDAGFRFRLERIRALRERKEEIAKQELAQAMGRLCDSERRLREVKEQLARAHARQRGAAAERVISGRDLIAGQEFVESVERQHRHGVRDVRRSQGEVSQRDAALNLAAQEHQMLQRLKERDRVDHVREVARREGEALDEVALDRFRRSVA